mmetsp:Transcript_38798/g.100302  ORF Transcript_38798/g.100302 Transcript_38798/m.100302 type:complete len:205 (-) Transcript_38798:1253-1867(-)
MRQRTLCLRMYFCMWNWLPAWFAQMYLTSSKPSDGSGSAKDSKHEARIQLVRSDTGLARCQMAFSSAVRVSTGFGSSGSSGSSSSSSIFTSFFSSISSLTSIFTSSSFFTAVASPSAGTSAAAASPPSASVPAGGGGGTGGKPPSCCSLTRAMSSSSALLLAAASAFCCLSYSLLRSHSILRTCHSFSAFSCFSFRAFSWTFAL